MPSEPKFSALRKRIGEYFRQRLSEGNLGSLAEYAALTFRPGGRLDSFEGNLIRRAGIAVLATLRYEPEGSRGEIPIETYGATTRTGGTVARSVRDVRLSLDLRRRPRPGARGRVIDPIRNPTVLDTALRLHHSCRTVGNGRRQAQPYVVFPPILLGFSPTSPPAFEDTQELRSEAARRLGLRVQELGRNGPVLLERLLREVWESVLIWPNSPENSTGNLLVPRRFCPSARGFLNTFEDFRQFVGVPTWNPAREVTVRRYENPARRIWQELGFGESLDFNQAFPAETIAEAERRMREALGEIGSKAASEDILDGLTTPDLPFIAWSTELTRLRRKIPSWAEPCCTDSDLKSAVRAPTDPLWVRYACCVQVVWRDVLARSLGATDWKSFPQAPAPVPSSPDDFPLETEPFMIAG